MALLEVPRNVELKPLQRQKTLLLQLHFALLHPAVRNYALRSTETAARVWRFFRSSAGLESRGLC